MTAAGLAYGIAMPAVAGQSDASLDLFGTVPLLPPSAETGKPATQMPRPAGANEAGPCLPELPCGTRLYGTVRKNGAVELQVPALRW